MEQRKKSLAELSSGWLLAKIKEYKIPLLASFLFGMLAYGFTFTNKLINHDDAFTMFAKGGTIELGRWGLNICRRLFPNFSMPWIYGIITIAFVSAAICLIIHIFQVKNKLLQILIAGNIIVFPALTSVFTFMFTSSSYGLSIFMAVLAAALMKRPRKLTVILALGFMVFSLSIYQAYITIAAGLLVLILIQELLQGRELKAVLLKGLLYVAFLVVSLGIYYAATQFILRWKGYSFSAYADNSMSFSIAELPGKALDAYKYFFRFIFDGNLSLVPTPSPPGCTPTCCMPSWDWPLSGVCCGRVLSLCGSCFWLP